MIAAVTYISPRNGGLSGGKIGIEGDTIFIFAQKMTTQFACQLIDKTRPTDKFPRWQSSRYRYGTLRLRGEYASKDAHVKQALLAMSMADGLAVTVTLDTGHSYAGTVHIMEDVTEWNAMPSKGAEHGSILCDMMFKFTGVVTGDGASGSDITDTGGSGTAELDLKRGAISVKDYQDTKGDYAVRPFIITGLGESGTAPLDMARNAAVAAAGGGEHAYPGDSTLKFKTVRARWAGIGVCVGEMVYSRWVLDCKFHRFKYSLAYISDGFTSVPLNSGSDSGDDPCAAASEGFSVTFRNRVIHTIPMQVIYAPCVWDSDPFAAVVGMVGKVNANTITLAGHNYDPITLRCDGLAQTERVVTASGAEKWYGYMKFVHKVGGWYKGKLICIRWKYLPLEGNQTIPSVGFDAAVRRLLEYESATFSSISTLCPLCY